MDTKQRRNRSGAQFNPPDPDLASGDRILAVKQN